MIIIMNYYLFKTHTHLLTHDEQNSSAPRSSNLNSFFTMVRQRMPKNDSIMIVYFVHTYSKETRAYAQQKRSFSIYFYK